MTPWGFYDYPFDMEEMPLQYTFTLSVRCSNNADVLAEMLMILTFIFSPLTRRKCPYTIPESHQQEAVALSSVYVSSEILMTDRLCWSVHYMMQISLKMLAQFV